MSDTAAGSIVRQVQFYFSDANLRRDKFMQEKLKQGDPTGFITIDTLLTFNRLKALTTDASVVADAVDSGSTLLKLSEDRASIGRIQPFVDASVSDDKVKACTGYLNRIPADSTIESLTTYLSTFGTVNLVRIPKSKVDTTRPHRGFAFVEFTDPESVAKLVEAIPRKPSAPTEVPADDDTPTKKEESGEEDIPIDEQKPVEANSSNEENPMEEEKPTEETKPKPMYALTFADWKAWNKVCRKKGRAPVEAEPTVHESGRLVRLTGDLTGATKNDLYSVFNELGQVKYVDFVGAATFATLRFATAEIAQDVVKKVAADTTKVCGHVLEAAVLDEAEQTKYWARVESEIAARAAMSVSRHIKGRQNNKQVKKRGRVGNAATNRSSEAATIAEPTTKKSKIEGDAEASAA